MANYNAKRSQYKTAKELLVEKTVLEIQQGLRVLVLMRGLPGSGKSSLAKEIVRKGLGSSDYSTFIYSADDYFTNPKTGQYNYDAQKISDAHTSTKLRALNAMASGVSPVIIDNTNVRIWEMEPYAQAAIKYHYFIEIVEPFTKWAFNAKELAQRNSHHVPLVKIEQMIEKYDKNISVEKLLGAIGVLYTGPPMYRLFPPLYFTYNSTAPAQQQTVQNSPPNLINFENEPNSQDVVCISDDETQQENTSPNFYLQGKHATTNALESEMKKVRTYNGYAQKPSTTAKRASEIKEARNVYPKLNLSSWGLSANAVSSWEAWEVVNPLKCYKSLEDQIISPEEAASDDVKEISDAATNTHSSDFALLLNESPSVQTKTLTANNRDINEGLLVNPYPDSPPKRTLLHKSSMTDDAFSLEESAFHCTERDITYLASLFPNIPVVYLRDVFEKCKGDVNWTVDLLLDDTQEILPIENQEVRVGDDISSSTNATDDNLQENLQDLQITNDSPIKRSVEKITSLQKHLENAFEISQKYYSEHTLKLKGQRQAGSNGNKERSFSSQEAITSKPELEQPSTSNIPTIVLSDSESEVDIDFPDIDSDNEEIIELNLGGNVIAQLETKLGFEEIMPQDFLPIVQLPLSLARQLYATYVESVLGQMEVQNQVLETIVKQDEEFALKLQQQEMEVRKPKIPDLQEIMNEQAAHNIYQKEVDQWKTETPDNLATMMTLQKLFTAFPRINAQTLMEIYHAYNNSYCETLEVLLASTDPSLINDPEGTLKEPPITENVVHEMKEAENEIRNCINTPDVAKSAQEYRDEADLHHTKHNELIQKAIQAYQKKQYPVAQFYSDVAKKHTQLYDQANNLAASAFLNEHSQKLQSFYTLDLHFLYVKEAVAALDMFIDKNIHLLNERKPCENLFIITGRGKRSEQGRSKLKPVIMTRLRKRKIRYWELNPGLLKIRILYTSPLTSNI